MNILQPFDREKTAESLKKRIRNEDNTGVGTLIASLHPVDAAAITVTLTEKEQKTLFEILSVSKIADIIEVMDTEHQVAVLTGMDTKVASKIAEEMASDEAADVLAGISEEKSKEILAGMSPEEAQEAKLLLSYPEDSAGALMSTESISFNDQMSIQDTIQALRKSAVAQDPQKFNYVYVVNDSNKLIGVLQMRDLVINDPGSKIKEIMKTEMIQTHVTTERNEVARIFRQYNLAALPVVDNHGTFLGIITADDAADLIHAVATEDMLKLEGISTDETRDMPWWKISKRRISWLSLNIFLNILAASVIAFYQDTLKSAIALAVFLPIISDMSGCSGMQAVAVSIRDLALDKISPKDFFRVLIKELIVGLANGLILGAQIGLVAYFWKGLPVLGLVVAAGLSINTILSVCIGGVVPLVLKRFRIDPAVASGPILTTITDIMGFFIVLSLATHYLKHLTP